MEDSWNAFYQYKTSREYSADKNQFGRNSIANIYLLFFLSIDDFPEVLQAQNLPKFSMDKSTAYRKKLEGLLPSFIEEYWNPLEGS